MIADILGHLVEFGGDQMVRDDVLEPLEPKGRESSQDRTLILDRRRQHAVEGREAIGRDKQEHVVAGVVNIADLALVQQWQAGESRIGKSSC